MHPKLANGALLGPGKNEGTPRGSNFHSRKTAESIERARRLLAHLHFDRLLNQPRSDSIIWRQGRKSPVLLLSALATPLNLLPALLLLLVCRSWVVAPVFRALFPSLLSSTLCSGLPGSNVSQQPLAPGQRPLAQSRVDCWSGKPPGNVRLVVLLACVPDPIRDRLGAVPRPRRWVLWQISATMRFLRRRVSCRKV